MPEVRYLGEEGGTRDTVQFGYVFEDGNPVDVTDEKHLAKFRGNRFFEVSELQPEASPTAVHRGRGSYSIMLGDEELKEGLSKADAETFNALSRDEQAEYLKD